MCSLSYGTSTSQVVEVEKVKLTTENAQWFSKEAQQKVERELIGAMTTLENIEDEANHAKITVGEETKLQIVVKGEIDSQAARVSELDTVVGEIKDKNKDFDLSNDYQRRYINYLQSIMGPPNKERDW